MQVQTNLIDSILDDETAIRKSLTVGHGNPMGMIMFWDIICYWHDQVLLKQIPKPVTVRHGSNVRQASQMDMREKMRQKCWNKNLPCYEKNKKYKFSQNC